MTYELPKALRTTSVGSFPKPEYLQAARNKASAGKFDPEELRSAGYHAAQRNSRAAA